MSQIVSLSGGNLTHDVQVRYTQTGKTYDRTGIAVKFPFLTKTETETKVIVENVAFSGSKKKDAFDGEDFSRVC